MNTRLKEEITGIVDKAVIDILEAVRSSVQSELLSLIEKQIEEPPAIVNASSIKTRCEEFSEMDKCKTKIRAKRMNEDRMRCRYSDDNGHRCKNRSKGPRFKYLCEKHLEK